MDNDLSFGEIYTAYCYSVWFIIGIYLIAGFYCLSIETIKEYLRKKKLTPVLSFTRENIFVRKFANAEDAERKTGISQSNILECCKGKRKTAGGYKWRYKN